MQVPKGILDESIWNEPQPEKTKKSALGKELKEKNWRKKKEKKEKTGEKGEEKAKEKKEKLKAKKEVKFKEEGEEKKGKLEERKEKPKEKEVKAERIDFSKTGKLSSLVFYPLISEKAVNVIEKENKLSFIVKKQATKQDVKKLVEETFAVKVKSVKSVNDAQGRKKMIVRLDERFKAREIATRLGVI